MNRREAAALDRWITREQPEPPADDCDFPRLADNPSKADEMAHWCKFLASLPAESYLASYLADSERILSAVMIDDVCCELVSAIRKERANALTDLADVKKELATARADRDKLTAELTVLRRDLARTRDSMADVARAAATLASVAAEQLARASK